MRRPRFIISTSHGARITMCEIRDNESGTINLSYDLIIDLADTFRFHLS